MYESPIEIMMRDITSRIAEQEDNAITAEVSRQMAINVDKDELMKALAYDRDQYNKGYEDAKRKYERPTGKWIYDGAYENFPIDGDIYHCSICKRSITTTLTRPTELFPFCHCGAKMEEANDESEDD